MNFQIYLKGFLNSITFESLAIIMNQMKNCVCAVKSKKGFYGTGFFCKVPIKNYFNIMPILIVDSDILDYKDISLHKTITFIQKGDKFPRTIFIDESRRTFNSIQYNISIIEIKYEDKLDIKAFLEMDTLLYKPNLNEVYKQKPVYLLQYAFGKNIEYALGCIRLINEEDSKFEYFCLSKEGSLGGPIINLSTFNIMGLQKLNTNEYNINIGLLLKKPIEEFIQQVIFDIKNEINDPDIKICFEKYGKKHFMSAKSYMMFNEIAFKYCKKFIGDENDFKFIFNNEELDPDSCKTLEELRIKDGSIIYVYNKF